MIAESSYEANRSTTPQDALHIPTVLMFKDPIAQAGIRQILSNTPFHVVGCVNDEGSNLPSLSEVKPVLFVVEAKHCPSEMADLITSVKAQCEAAQIVLLADSLDLNLIRLAYRAGAAGLLQTTTTPEVLIKRLELVALGERAFPAAALLSLIEGGPQYFRREVQQEWVDTEMKASLSETRVLSEREQQILRLLMGGDPNKVIARKLGMAEATVKVHIKAVLRKIRAQNRTQAAMWAASHLPPVLTEMPSL